MIHENHGQHPPWPLLPPLVLRQPLRCEAPVRHIVGDAGCAQFAIILPGGWAMIIVLSGNF
jgi:hypothetical protein